MSPPFHNNAKSTVVSLSTLSLSLWYSVAHPLLYNLWSGHKNTFTWGPFEIWQFMTRFQTQLGLTVLYLYTRIEFIKIFCKYYIHTDTEKEIDTDYSVYLFDYVLSRQKDWCLLVLPIYQQQGMSLVDSRLVTEDKTNCQLTTYQLQLAQPGLHNHYHQPLDVVTHMLHVTTIKLTVSKR